MPKTAKKSSHQSTKKPQNKSAFIRSLPGTMSAAEVVAKGKAAGISLSEKYVYNIRGAAKTAKKKKAVKTSPVPAQKPTQPTSKKPQSKTAFVLSLSKDMSAAEVVAKAKATGIELTDKYVYNIRATARSAAKKKTSGAKVASTVTPKKKPVAATKTKTSAEDLLKAIAAEIGLRKAIEILQEQRAQVRAVLGG
jgi:hypothetical protein